MPAEGHDVNTSYTAVGTFVGTPAGTFTGTFAEGLWDMTFRLPAPVDVAAMVDVEDRHRHCFLVDLVDDAVLTATRCECAGELLSERLAHPSRLVEQVAGDEVHDGGGDGFGKTLRDLPGGCSRDDECVARLATASHARTGRRLARGVAPH